MGMNADERIRIIIDWINNNPEEAKKAQQQMEALTEQYHKARNALNEYAKTPQGKQQKAAIEEEKKRLQTAWKAEKSRYGQKKESFEKADVVGEKIKSLGDVYQQVEEMAIDFNKPLKDQKEIMEALKNTSYEEIERLAKFHPVAKALINAWYAQNKAMKTNQINWDKTGDSLKKFGKAVGFYGFITSFSIQRVLVELNNIRSFFESAIDKTANWTDSLVEVATSMAYMNSQGLMTADMQENLSGTMDKLMNQGPKVEALWMGLKSAWTSVQVTLATALIPTLTQMIQLVGALLSDPSTQNALRQFAVGFGQLGLAILPILPHITNLLSWVANIIVSLKDWYGVLIPVVFGAFLLGTAMTLLGPPLIVAGYLIKYLINIKKYWAMANVAVGNTLVTLRTRILSVGIAALSVASILFMFMRMGTAQAKTVGTDLAGMADDINIGVVSIRDELGNLLYTIDTTTGEVRNAKNEIIGHWDYMTGIISTDTGKIIGYYDNMTNKFNGMPGGMEQGKVDLTNLFNGLSTNLDNLSTKFDNFDPNLKLDTTDFDNSLNDMQSSMDTFSWAILIGGAVSTIAQIASIFKGGGTTVGTSFGASLVAKLSSVFAGIGAMLSTTFMTNEAWAIFTSTATKGAPLGATVSTGMDILALPALFIQATTNWFTDLGKSMENLFGGWNLGGIGQAQRNMLNEAGHESAVQRNEPSWSVPGFQATIEKGGYTSPEVLAQSLAQNVKNWGGDRDYAVRLMGELGKAEGWTDMQIKSAQALIPAFNAIADVNTVVAQDFVNLYGATETAKTKMDEWATKLGLTTTQIERLNTALGNITGPSNPSGSAAGPSTGTGSTGPLPETYWNRSSLPSTTPSTSPSSSGSSSSTAVPISTLVSQVTNSRLASLSEYATKITQVTKSAGYNSTVAKQVVDQVAIAKSWTLNQISTVKNLIPAFAKGGIVNKPTVALVGEAGTELISPWQQVTEAFNEMEIYQKSVVEANKTIAPTSNIINQYFVTNASRADKNTEITNLPAFAKGGIVTKPTVGLIGEAGPEEISPWEKVKEAFEELRLYQQAVVEANTVTNNYIGKVPTMPVAPQPIVIPNIVNSNKPTQQNIYIYPSLHIGNLVLNNGMDVDEFMDLIDRTLADALKKRGIA